MIPIFTSHYSRKSLLTFLEPEKAEKETKQSLFTLCKKHEIKNPVVVEDYMTGFMELFQNAKKLDIFPRFGLTFKFNNSTDEACADNWHKVIVFLKNTDGYKDLVKFHNQVHIHQAGIIYPENLKTLWTKNMILFIPHYDAWHSRNAMYDVNCIPDFAGLDTHYFRQSNNLPFDNLISSRIPADAASITDCKSIFYEKREDFKYWQTYICALNFNHKGKNRSIESPAFSHCHSDDFCFESYLESK